MPELNSLNSRINSVNPSTFDQVAIELFNYQAQHNSVFKKYLLSLGHSLIAHSLSDLVFLPIEFFKHHEIKTGHWQEETIFESSGTTGVQTSRHYIKDLNQYKEGTKRTFEAQYGDLSDYTILALLPSYLERGNSGLIAMVDYFMKDSGKVSSSGFFLDNYEELHENLVNQKAKSEKTILWGVTFALLDFAQAYPLDFEELIVMETGGMKGRRQEMIRTDVHSELQQAFNVRNIQSEYGMTELNSQAYAQKEGVFSPAAEMKVMIRDINDPFDFVPSGKTGALNIIDLSNRSTCAFVETKDLGRAWADGTFQVMGRMDNSDIRGCNLMVS